MKTPLVLLDLIDRCQKVGNPQLKTRDLSNEREIMNLTLADLGQ